MGMIRNRLGHDEMDKILSIKDKPIEYIAHEVGCTVNQVAKVLSGQAYSSLTKIERKPISNGIQGRKPKTGEVGISKLSSGKFSVRVKGQYIGVYCTLEEAVFARDASLNAYCVPQ